MARQSSAYTTRMRAKRAASSVPSSNWFAESVEILLSLGLRLRAGVEQCV